MRGDIIEVSEEMLCCGVNELDGISQATPQEVLEDLLLSVPYYDEPVYAEEPNAAHLIFTQATAKKDRNLTGYGYKLRNLIEAEDLGSVTDSNSGVNPKTKRHIVVFTWTLNRRGIVNWVKRYNAAKKAKQKQVVSKRS